MNAPHYVDLPGASTFPPVIEKKGCHARIYVLAAEQKPLQETIDHWLSNDVYDYVALPWVAMYTMPIKEVRLKDAEPGSPWDGFAKETDIAFAVMLAAVRKSPFPQQPVVIDHFAIAFPYILVNNPMGLVTGREVWGFRQALGTFDCVKVDTNDKKDKKNKNDKNGVNMPIAASTLVMPRFEKDCEQTLLEVVRVDAPSADEAPAPWSTVLTDLGHLCEKKVLRLLRYGLDACTLLKQLAKVIQKERQIRSPFLLQLRNCAKPGHGASYQAVIEAPLMFKMVLPPPKIKVGLQPKVKIDWPIQPIRPIPCVTLGNYKSYPLVSSLGIKPDSKPVHPDDPGPYKVTPLMAFKLQLSIEVMFGRVIGKYQPRHLHSSDISHG